MKENKRYIAATDAITTSIKGTSYYGFVIFDYKTRTLKY